MNLNICVQCLKLPSRADISILSSDYHHLCSSWRWTLCCVQSTAAYIIIEIQICNTENSQHSQAIIVFFPIFTFKDFSEKYVYLIIIFFKECLLLHYLLLKLWDNFSEDLFCTYYSNFSLSIAVSFSKHWFSKVKIFFNML